MSRDRAAAAAARFGAALLLILPLLTLAPLPAQAGQNCETKRPSQAQVIAVLGAASRTARWLDASGAQVVVIARRGQNLGRYGLRWSHLGYAYRDDGARAWRVVHKLNLCGTAEGALYRQGLAEFFSDDLQSYEAGLALPTPEVQATLKPLLQDDFRAGTLHTRAYSMVAYPWARRYQQSNQWALETLAMAVEPSVSDRGRAQAWLRFKGYQPSVLHIDAVTRLGARVGAAHIAFDDHPATERFSDRIATVTVDSVFDFLQRSALAGAPTVLR